MSAYSAPVPVWGPGGGGMLPEPGPSVPRGPLPGTRPQGAWAAAASGQAHTSPTVRSAQPPADAGAGAGAQRATFARAGCRPAPPARTATLTDSASGTHDHRLEPDHEAFGRSVTMRASTPGAPPGLDAPQRSVASQEDADGWVTRSGQQRQAAAAPLPTTVARTIDGRELTREPQVLAELHAQEDVKHLFSDYKPDVRDPSNTMIRIATRDFDPERMKRACKLMDRGWGLQRAAKEASVYKSQLKEYYEKSWAQDSDDDDDESDDESSDEDGK